jgi:hypothetical protein
MLARHRPPSPARRLLVNRSNLLQQQDHRGTTWSRAFLVSEPLGWLDRTRESQPHWLAREPPGPARYHCLLPRRPRTGPRSQPRSPGARHNAFHAGSQNDHLHSARPRRPRPVRTPRPLPLQTAKPVRSPRFWLATIPCHHVSTFTITRLRRWSWNSAIRSPGAQPRPPQAARAAKT